MVKNEKMKTTFKKLYIILFFTILLIFILLNFPYFREKKNRQIKDRFKMEEFNDTIYKVFYDFGDHNSPKIILNNGKVIDFSFVVNSDEIMLKSKNGYLLKKSKNSINLKLSNEDTSMIIKMKFPK